MKKTIGLCVLAGTLQAQVPAFTGHMVSCGDGYTVFRTYSGELIRTSDAVATCAYYNRYREWRVFTAPGGAHPDAILAIEPAPTAEWEYAPPVQVSAPRAWRWFKWLRK